MHVSQLEPFQGQLPHLPYIPEWVQGQSSATPRVPDKILARRLVKRQNRAALQLCVQCHGLTPERATWEFADEFEKKEFFIPALRRRLSKRGKY